MRVALLVQGQERVGSGSIHRIDPELRQKEWARRGAGHNPSRSYPVEAIRFDVADFLLFPQLLDGEGFCAGGQFSLNVSIEKRWDVTLGNDRRSSIVHEGSTRGGQVDLGAGVDRNFYAVGGDLARDFPLGLDGSVHGLVFRVDVRQILDGDRLDDEVLHARNFRIGPYAAEALDEVAADACVAGVDTAVAHGGPALWPSGGSLFDEVAVAGVAGVLQQFVDEVHALSHLGEVAGVEGLSRAAGVVVGELVQEVVHEVVHSETLTAQGLGQRDNLDNLFQEYSRTNNRVIDAISTNTYCVLHFDEYLYSDRQCLLRIVNTFRKGCPGCHVVLILTGQGF